MKILSDSIDKNKRIEQVRNAHLAQASAVAPKAELAANPASSVAVPKEEDEVVEFSHPFQMKAYIKKNGCPKKVRFKNFSGNVMKIQKTLQRGGCRKKG